MKTALRLCPALFMLMTWGLSLGCVSAWADVRRDVNDLKQSSYQYRKDIADLKAEVERLKAANQSLDSIRNSQKTLLERVNDLHEEVQNLMGQVESEVNDAKKLTRQTAADIDVLKTSGGGGEEIGKRLAAVEHELALIKKKLEIRDVPEAQGEADEENMHPPGDSAEGQYKEAYDLFKARKYNEARSAFEDFLQKQKGHKWAGNAQYWIGETYYGQKTYDKAILSYDDVIRQYPKSNKVPDAMLKQGYAFIKLKDPLAAKGVLRTLVQKYPDSKAADQARQKLKSLK